ncbi:MAG: GDSL-type esterase/lipase family protein, partial [Vicinamibacterales bacterium]
LSLTGVSSVIWLEGINDFGAAVGTSVDTVQQSMRDVVSRLHEKGIRVFGATLTSAVGNGSAADSLAREVKRQMLNAFIRTSGLFDGVFDFDRATSDPATGAMRDAFIPNSTDGGPGDHLHPNRQGYAAMADVIEIEKLVNW